MTDTTVLLFSDDPLLIEAIHEVVHSLHKVRLRIVAEIEELLSRSPRITDAVILIHLAKENDTVQASRLLRMLASTRQDIPVIVIGDSHRPEEFLELLRLGAADCLNRPLDLQRLSLLIDVLTVRARCTARVSSALTPTVASLNGSKSYFFLPRGAMGMLMEQVKRVAPQNMTVLLSGETGTGKSCLARVIHELSPRASKPFLVINCGALLPSLIESELFGHVKGAFTGADRDHNGKFTDVGGGTLLLDEIDSLPLAVQPKLLRALEERVFEPVGSNRSCALQARLIVASNRDLDREVAEGRFRSDLYYRLNVVNFTLPPLRERRDTIPALAERFLVDFAASNGRSVQGLREEALQALQRYDWPGNIRELRNTIERAVALCAGSFVELDDLPEAVRREPTKNRTVVAAAARSPACNFVSGTLAETKDEAEYQRIVSALRRNNNNRCRAAAELGISRMTLYNKLHHFGLIRAI